MKYGENLLATGSKIDIFVHLKITKEWSTLLFPHFILYYFTQAFYLSQNTL